MISLLVAGGSMLDARYSILDAGYSMLDTRYWMLDKCNSEGSESLPFIEYRESSIEYQVVIATRDQRLSNSNCKSDPVKERMNAHTHN